MKKILWVSEINVNTGFARVSHGLLKFLSGLYDITVLDIYRTIEGNYVSFDTALKVKIEGKENFNDSFGIERLCKIAPKYDMIFMIQDVWNIDKILSVMRQNKVDVPPVVCYFPVDAKSHYKKWYENFDMVAQPITYTKFAFDVVKEASGIEPKIIPHGIDTTDFYEVEASKAEQRALFFRDSGLKNPDSYNNSFIFLSANRNQSRKRLDVVMYAYKLFLEETKATDSILYMHCGNTDDSHINVTELAEKLGITKHIILSYGANGIPSFDVPTLNMIYNICDVGINTGLGEGWGLCQTEHAATGAPQIVPNHSACAELFSGIDDDRLIVNLSAEFMINNIMTVGGIVSAKDVANKMVGLYNLKRNGLFKKIQQESKQRFTDDKYKWETVAGQFKDIFDNVLAIEENSIKSVVSGR